MPEVRDRQRSDRQTSDKSIVIGYKLTFDLLTLKVVSESRVTWATFVPSLVFLGLSVLEPYAWSMWQTEVRQTDVRQKHRLMPPPYGGGGGIIKATDMVRQLKSWITHSCRIWPTCASQCWQHPAALICVLPFTVTSSFHGLTWPAMGLAVLPSRVQWPRTVCHLIFATRLCLLPVS